VIIVTVNTMRKLTTFLIPMTRHSTFGTGKLSRTIHSVVSVFMVFEAPECIWNVGCDLHSNESNFMELRKTESPNLRIMVPVFIRHPSR